MERRTAGLALLIVAILALVIGTAGIALDYAGLGDHAGFDVRDLAPLAIGFILAGFAVPLIARR